MSAFRAWCRYELRARWRPLLMLALLTAFAGATVMAAAAGARRGSSAVDRLQAETLPAHAVVLPNEPGFDWNRIRDLPEVEALSTFVVGGYGIEEVPPEEWEDVVGFPPADAEVWRTIERPVLLAGRLPDPARADEVVVSANFRAKRDRGVGDRVTLLLYAPAQIDRSNEGEELGPPEGPSVNATIVGVIRSPWFSDRVSSPDGAVVPSPGLYARHPGSLVGADASGFINALVRLDEGEAGLPAFKERLAEVTGREDIDVWNQAAVAGHTRDVAGFEATCLLAFALAAATASVFLVGQAVSRFTNGTAAELQVLRALGLSPRQSRAAAMIGPTAFAVLGAAAGAGAALVASGWFPIGTAAAAEPDPGVRADLVVLGAGVVALPVFVAAGAWFGAWSAMRRRPAPARTSTVVSAAAFGPVPVAVGARFALDGGRGRQAVPVGPAFVGAIVGVAGVVGALTFSAGVTDATSSFDRFGQTYDVATFFGFNGEDFAPAEEVLRTAASDEDVAEVDDARMDIAQVGKVGLSLYTYAPVGNALDVVLTDGRMPVGDGEVALAPRSAETLDAGVGDTVEVIGPDGKATVTVTGVAFVPAGPHNDYASGGWVRPGTYDALFDGYKFHFGLVATRAGADPEAVAARLSESTELDFGVGPIIPPEEQSELRQVRAMPLVLAVFLALLALGAVGHTLTSTVRRRRHDLAVLRALGLTGRDIRLAVVTQASIIALVGLALGVPLGAAIGRTVWGVVADSTPVAHLAPTAWLALILTPLGAVVAANVLAAWPAHRAATLRVGHVLRAD